MKNLKYICLLLGTSIGAGFASGKELTVFFARFGWLGLVYLAPLFALMSLIIFWALRHQQKLATAKVHSINRLKTVVFFIVYLIFSASMLSAFANIMAILFSPELKWLYILIGLAILTLSLSFGVKGLIKCNLFLVPILVLLLIIIATNGIFFKTTTNISFCSNVFTLPIFTLLYATANLIVCDYAIKHIALDTTPKQAKIIAISFSGVFCLILLFGGISLVLNPVAMLSDMPFLWLAERMPFVVGILFSIAFVFSIVTTLICTTNAVKDYLPTKLNSSSKIIITLMATFVLSLFGFSDIVEKLYPAIGILGIILVIIESQVSLKFLFYFSNYKRHKRRKKAKNNSASHN